MERPNFELRDKDKVQIGEHVTKAIEPTQSGQDFSAAMDELSDTFSIIRSRRNSFEEIGQVNEVLHQEVVIVIEKRNEIENPESLSQVEEAILDSIVGSQRAAGVPMTEAVAREVLIETREMPLPNLGVKGESRI